MNAGIYHDNGVDGSAYSNNTGGRFIRIAVLGGAFDADSSAFVDCLGCSSRAIPVDCYSSPCVENQEQVPSQEHSMQCAGLAVGSIRQDQMSIYSTDLGQLERTGVAEEPEVYLIAITVNDTNTVKRALEYSIENDIDIVNSSYKQAPLVMATWAPTFN